MALKLIGCVFIIASCLGFGYKLSIKDVIRRDELLNVKNIVNTILSNLEFNRMTFVQAVESAIKDKESATMFKDVIKGIKNNNTINKSWKYAINKNKENACFSKEDIQSIIELGEGFTSNDFNLQKIYAQNLINYIDYSVDLINKNIIKNNKIYRSVSVTIGLFIVILLV